MANQNPIERRAEMLAKEFERRQQAFIRVLTEPHPPFRVKMDEMTQLRRYLDDERSGFLFSGRISNGGTVDDAEMDRYAAFGMRMKSKHAPDMVAHEMFDVGTPDAAMFEKARRLWAEDQARGGGEDEQ